MRLLTKVLLNLVRYFFILLFLLFATATFLGKSYLQTSLLFLLIIVMIWWPPAIQKRWNNIVSVMIRMVLILALCLVSFMAFNEPKSSIYLSEDQESELMEIYDRHVAEWPEGTKDQIVGDAEFARSQAESYPDIRVEVLESGHLIAVEHADYVNTLVKEFIVQ